MVAEEGEFAQEYLDEMDEKVDIHIAPFLATRSSYSVYQQPMSDRIFFRQAEIIRKLADDGPCVIVGRCADYILRINPQLFTIFITANEEDRCREVSKRLDSDYETARRFITKHEAERARCYNYFTSKTWGAAQSYDICINSSILGWEGTAKLLSSIIRKKFNLLTLQA
jgi:cytidylate kinase